MAENGVDEQQHHEEQQGMIAVRVVAMVPVLVVRLGSCKRSRIDHSKQVVRWPPPGSPQQALTTAAQSKETTCVVVFVSCSGGDCKVNVDAQRFLAKHTQGKRKTCPPQQANSTALHKTLARLSSLVVFLHPYFLG